MKPCCPCDAPRTACAPDIAAGLPSLPRQTAGFPEYRLAMLRDIPLHAPLEQWRARQGDDLGIMILEMWAYVLDVLAFYDERIANETYLRTAVLRPSVRKLVELIAYRPRPALAASAVLALIAEGHRSVKVSPRTGFRSDAFDGEPPQVFETEVEYTVHPLKNEWTVAPVRANVAGDELLLELETAALSRDQLVLLRWSAGARARAALDSVFVDAGVFELEAARAGSHSLMMLRRGMAEVADRRATASSVSSSPTIAARLQAGRVSGIETINARDGASYQKLTMEPAPELDSVPLDKIAVQSPTRLAAVNTFDAGAVRQIGRQTEITLDALYSEMSEQDAVIIRRGRALHEATITAIRTHDVTVNPGTGTNPAVTVPATKITVSPQVPAPWAADPRRLAIHFGMTESGRLTRVAVTELNLADFALPGLPLEGVLEPFPDGVARPNELLLLDAQDSGRLANGGIEITPRGAGKVHLFSGTPQSAPPLRTPVTIFGNVVRATRGESVLDEVLGSGDSSQAFQSFTLGKQPLTYINDPAAPDGLRSTLEVRVNGIRWKEASSFFGAQPESEIYIVRQNDKGDSVVSFGDGVTGARPPTGIDNVTATYRFGAGAAKPPAGAIGQLSRPVEGLRRVVNPVAAAGGADGDKPEDIRKNAPASALILGRAVSVPDFEALTREFGGVINAHADWVWDETSQSAVVKVCFITDGGNVARELRAFLIGLADPNTPLITVQAEAQRSQLVIDLEIDPRFNGQTVAQRVREALTNPSAGVLALQNIPIGCLLFRSRIFDAVLSVEGTVSVRAMTVDGQPAPFAIATQHGRYRDFLDGVVIAGGAARS